MIAKMASPEAADALIHLCQMQGDFPSLLASLDEQSTFAGNEPALGAIQEMRTLYAYLQAFSVPSEQLIFDLSLARGMDYYTGVIFEAVLRDGAISVGSIAGGGRYDELVGKYSKGRKIPAVGFSVGIERLMAIKEAEAAKRAQMRASPTQVMVVSIGNDMLLHRMKCCSELWAAGIAAELLHRDTKKPQSQLKYANDQMIPIAVIMGEDEIKNDQVQIKVLGEEGSSQETVARSEMLAHIQRILASPSSL